MSGAAEPRRRGRPAKVPVSLAHPPQGYIRTGDALELARQYLGRGIDRARFRADAELGLVPEAKRFEGHHTPSGTTVLLFTWRGVRAYLDARLRPIVPPLSQAI